jgi:CHASE3 domain sensor protein
MNSDYVVYRDTIIEALDHLDQFKTKMDNFIVNHPQYSYTEELKEENNTWKIKINVKKDEQINTKAT